MTPDEFRKKKLILLVSFFSMVAMLLILAFTTHGALHGIHSNLREYETHIRHVKMVSEMKDVANRRMTLLVNMALENDQFLREETYMEFMAIAPEFIRVRDQLAADPHNEEETIALQQLTDAIKDVTPHIHEVAQLLIIDETEKGQKLLYEEAIPKLFIILNLLDKVRQVHDINSLSSIDDAMKAYRTGEFSLYTLTAILILLSSGLILYVYNYTNRMDKALCDTLNALEVNNRLLGTRVKERTRELQTAKEAAEAASRHKSEFLTSMSHELRTPLNTILGFSELLTDECKDSEQMLNAQSIHKAGSHLLNLINELLDLAKIEANKMTISMEPANLRDTINECIKLVRPIIDEKHIHLDLFRDRYIPYVMADHTKLKQCLLNLISNAVKYSPPNSAIAIRWEHQETDTYRIIIEDSGPGIPLELQSNLFEPFNRLGEEGGLTQGSGIGLVITRHLVEMMGGQIGLDSAPGEGSTFWIELKQAAPPETPSDDALDEEREYDTGPLPRNRRDDLVRILYIEDNPDNMRLVEHIIGRKTPYELLTADTPTLGLRMADEQQPDIILLDINLPEMNGYEVIRELKKNPATRDITVIALSANALPEDIDRAMTSGFADYITKPVNVSVLLSKLKQALKAQQD